jgi:peptidoglycan/xylan/chitin deacetylase (PgdA/CDA1 family)
VPDHRLRNRSGDAIFLCYHSVSPEGPPYLTVTRDLFEVQLDAIERYGFRSGDLGALADLVDGRPIPRTAFLTFDDGFLDNHETVMPLLFERGHKAFVFVLPPLVDTAGALAWPEVADYARHYSATMRSVSWEMLGEMKEAGFEVGSHGLTHAYMPQLSAEELRQELSDSRHRIAERLGSCDTVAYPFGGWSPQVAEAASACGYRFAFTLPVKIGQRSATRFTIPRINVDYRDRGPRLAAKLSPLGRRVYLSTTLGSLRTLSRRRVRR